MQVRFFTLLFAFLLCTCGPALAQSSYEIEVTIDGYEEEYLTLANYLLDKQYIVDTAYRSETGSYTFGSDTNALDPGMYLVVLAPDNQYFQLLMTEGEQNFRAHTQLYDLSDVRITESPENELFYEYLGYLSGQQKQAAPLREVLADSTASAAEKEQAQAFLSGLDSIVSARQVKYAADNPGSFTAAIIEANKPMPPPEFAEITDEEQRRERQWRWLQNHYFDPVDLQDDRLLRTPFLFQRIDYFINKLTVRHPDTIAVAIDGLLAKMDPQGELFKYYTVHFVNDAAASKIVGMDAVYVHMIDNYYKTGKAWWADDEQKLKMIDNADKIRPLLIGKTAPDINMVKEDGTPVSLYDIDSKYTVLYFWQPDCASCKKSTPYMSDFFAKWKDRGVTIFAVCTKTAKETEKCWNYIRDKEIGDWVQTTDPYQRYYRAYDIRSTPTIFVLDENKEILSKRIGAEQLDGLLTALEEEEGDNDSGK